MSMKKIVALCAVLSTLLFVATGCVTEVTSPAPTSSVSNEKYGFLGTYTASLGCSMFEADKAIRNAAILPMHLTELSRINEQNVIAYEYKDLYENRVSVTLSLDNNNQAAIAIKMAKTGDKLFSQKFLNAIDEELHRTAPAPAAE